MTNDELLAAWKRKLPGVEPTDRELSAFALQLIRLGLRLNLNGLD